MAETEDHPTSSESVAEAPFNNPHSDADIIFRSRDGTEFYLHKPILRLASEFFADMFSLPHPGGSHSSCSDGNSSAGLTELPIVPVDEDKQTFDLLLRFCYPMKRPVLQDVHDAVSLLRAGTKYQMEDIIFIAKEALNAFCEREPLDVFRVACQNDLEDVALAAAKAFSAVRVENSSSGSRGTHIYPIDDCDSDAEMDGLPTLSYFRLLQYYRADADVRARFKGPPEEGTISYRFTSPFRHPSSQCSADDHQEPYTTVPSQFQDALSGDVVIRSSDDVEFYVHRQLLALASPVLKRLLSSGLEDSSSQDINNSPASASGPHRIDLPESAQTLSVLLQLCYPLADPPFKTGRSKSHALSKARCILDAAKKYQMPRAIDFARKIHRSLLKHLPVRVFLTAMQFEWVEEAKEGALYAVYEHSDEEGPEMEVVTAGVYRDFLVYRQCCREIIFSEIAGAPLKSHDDTYWNGPAGPGQATVSWLKNPEDAQWWRLVQTRQTDIILHGFDILERSAILKHGFDPLVVVEMKHACQAFQEQVAKVVEEVGKEHLEAYCMFF